MSAEDRFTIVTCGGNHPQRTTLGGPVQTSDSSYTEHCPLCDTVLEEQDHGFGLAYGGYGPYITCPNATCPWFIKECYGPDEE